MKKIKNYTETIQRPILWRSYGHVLSRCLLILFLSISFGADWGTSSCFSQCGTPPLPALTFINPSFEGPSCAGCQPGPWVNCGGTPDTQPGSWGFTQAASNGNSYVSFLLAGASAGGYFEGSSQALSSCMTAGQVYSFSIDLAHSDIYNTAGPGDCYSSLEILGSSGLCSESEVLWQSGSITNTAWQTYTVTLTPTSNWCYVTFRPYWISSCTGYVNIMVDNLGPMEPPPPTLNATVSADISCSQNISGTNACPLDSIILTGAFSSSSIHATILTDSTWQTNVTYPMGAASSQTIAIEAFLTIGGSLYDTITFNLIDITPDFSADTVCQGGVTAFTDISTISSDSIIGRVWDFGDGSPTNTAQNPTHAYANSGIYHVLLQVTTSGGCIDTISKPVQVSYNPVAGFTAANVCLGDSIHFTNTSTINSSTSISTYLWDFDDSSPNSSLTNPSHYYSLANTYTVTLITTTIDGCTDVAVVPVKTFDPPSSSFTFNNTCLFDSASFTNTSINPTMGSIASWSWNFGDGSPLNISDWSPGHQYAVPGNYQFTLITYSSNLACPDTLKDSISVFPMPDANFSFADVCLNQAMNFNDLSSVSTGSIVSWAWDFGDGAAPDATQNPIHIYANQGISAVSLIVTTNNGCKDTIIKNVIVHPLPNPQFYAANVCDGSFVQFSDLSDILNTDSLQSWTWNFGDGSPVFNNQNTSHLFPSYGSYTVELVVVSDFGCIDSISKTSIINPNPDVDFTTNDTTGCEPWCVSFQNLSSIVTGNNVSSQWNYGDNSPTSNLQDANNCYENDSVFQPITYNVTLTVTSDSGCVSILSKSNYITVYPNPYASFAVQPQTATITDPVISITDLSIGANFWAWDFGDSDTSSLSDPLPHTYPDTGTYTITLITSTQYNCIDTASKTIIIEPDFLLYIPNAFTPDGDGINDYFSPKGIFVKTFQMSIFDRWGNLIFYSDDINKPWDGKANYGSGIAQTDVYVYSIKVTDYKKQKHNYNGRVTLLR